ncbi:MAG: CDP-alcohol phosphatidyltransferase family protein [Bacteroidales bacterium]|nr:CDP-alcohol phosphatidyltransferase family protein [Bacteroidales bacterium]MDD4670240.1 CDP-alcohol phosphatidyltransferase family protein [Bacteroidales bacterium]
MEQKQAVRIQTSILNGIEKKALIWMAQRMPKWITSDSLTLIGIMGAVIAAVGYVLSDNNILFLWIATFGIVMNWFGDSLDGTIARVRNAQRPIYGYYLDHNVDIITLFIVCMGAGLSSIVNLYVAMFVFSAYMIMTVFTYINVHLKGEFRLTYGKLGPTEFRLIIIIINTIIMYCPAWRDCGSSFTILGQNVSLNMFDYMASGVAVLLIIFYIVCFIVDLRKFAKIDPKHKSN